MMVQSLDFAVCSVYWWKLLSVLCLHWCFDTVDWKVILFLPTKYSFAASPKGSVMEQMEEENGEECLTWFTWKKSD